MQCKYEGYKDGGFISCGACLAGRDAAKQSDFHLVPCTLFYDGVDYKSPVELDMHISIPRGRKMFLPKFIVDELEGIRGQAGYSKVGKYDL